MTIIESIKKQIYETANKNLYRILMCKCNLNIGYEYKTKEQYLKLLNELKRLNETKTISK